MQKYKVNLKFKFDKTELNIGDVIELDADRGEVRKFIKSGVFELVTTQEKNKKVVEKTQETFPEDTYQGIGEILINKDSNFKKKLKNKVLK